MTDYTDHWTEIFRKSDMDAFNKSIRQYGDVNKIVDNYDQTLLHWCVVFKNNEMVKVCLKAGADGNTRDVWGDTPLHSAGYYGYRKIIRSLVESGLNVDGKILGEEEEDYSDDCIHGDDGNTPLHVAAYRGKIEAVKEFLTLGANPFAKNKYGATAQQIAEHRGHTGIANILQQAMNREAA